MDASSPDPVAALWALGDGKFEWKDGQVVEHPWVSGDELDIASLLTSTLTMFAEERTGGRVFGRCFIERLDENTVRAPDVAYVRKNRADRIHETHLEGGADLAVEIVVEESRRRDRGEKFYEYERAGVEEYWLVDHERQRAEFYRLSGAAYEPVLPDSEGRLYSSVLPGFFIRVDWLWNRPTLKEAWRELGLLS